MKRVRGLCATTLRDRQGDQLTLENLKQMVDLINRSFIPIDIEHDPRIPPVGRMVTSRLVPLDDGEMGVEFEGEIFEDGDQIELASDAKCIPRSSHDRAIHYDRMYNDPKDMALIDEIASIIGSGPPIERMKKSLDPLSVIAISLVVGRKFFENLTDDLYKKVKESLLALLNRHREQGLQFVVVEFSLTCRGPSEIDVEVLFTNPSDQDIEWLKGLPVQTVREQIEPFLDVVGLVKVVMKCEAGKLIPIYGLRSDSVVISPSKVLTGARSEGSHVVKL